MDFVTKVFILIGCCVVGATIILIPYYVGKYIECDERNKLQYLLPIFVVEYLGIITVLFTQLT